MPQLIIGLIVLAIAVKYWYLLITIGIIVLAGWGVAKLVNNWSAPETQKHNNTIKNPSLTELNSTRPDNITLPQVDNSTPIPTFKIELTTNHQPPSSPHSKPNRSAATIFGTSAHVSPH